jgi:hypothetical protein
MELTPKWALSRPADIRFGIRSANESESICVKNEVIRAERVLTRVIDADPARCPYHAVGQLDTVIFDPDLVAQ